MEHLKKARSATDIPREEKAKKIVTAFSQIFIYTSSIVNPMLMSSPLSQAVVMDFKGMSRSSENYKENYR